MKNFTFIALISLGSISLLSADQYSGGCSSGRCGSPWGNQQNYRQDNRNYNQSGQYSNDQDNRGRYFDEAIENRDNDNDDDQDNYDQSRNMQQRGPQSGYYQQRDQYGNDQRGNWQQRGPQSGNYQQRDQYGNDQRGNWQQRGPQSGNYQQRDQSGNDQRGNWQQRGPQSANNMDNATTEQDRQINLKIREKLRQWMSEKSLNALVIKTNNGEVVILGIVDKPEDIQKTHDQIKEIDGVKNVDNQVKVQR